MRGTDSRHIRPNEVRLSDSKHEVIDDDGHRYSNVQWELVYPCEIRAKGKVQGNQITWSRSLNSPNGRTTYGSAANIKQLATGADQAIRKGQDIQLPLISYYGTGRLWQEPREALTAPRLDAGVPFLHIETTWPGPVHG